VVEWVEASLLDAGDGAPPTCDGKWMRPRAIGYAVRQFTNGDERPVFCLLGYFSRYDWGGVQLVVRKHG